jgi:nitrate reductase alpha subunit
MSARRNCVRKRAGLPLAFATRLGRPPRQQNSTSFFYAHTDQWRYETVASRKFSRPPAEPGDWAGSFIDYNAKAERMGWLPSAPALKTNPLDIRKSQSWPASIHASMLRVRLKSGDLEMSCMDPDHPRQLAAQHVRLALEPARLVRQGS